MSALVMTIFIFLCIIGFLNKLKADDIVATNLKSNNRSFKRRHHTKNTTSVKNRHNADPQFKEIPLANSAEKTTKTDFTAIRLQKYENLHWNKEFLSKIDWKLYEDICMEYLRIKNCDADVTCTGADGGIDIKVNDKNGKVIALAQCKSWNKPIGVSLIRELFGIMAAEKVKHGIFLTTSIFSNEAKQFAQNKALLLVDGDEFIKAISLLRLEDKKRIDILVGQDDSSTPTCVHCNLKLVKRTTKSGPNAGRIFWGCANYPKCKITMHFAKAALA
jgi:restriction system protein